MLKSELIELVNTVRAQKCESNYIEIKAANGGCPKIIDTLSSFSNQANGGTILFGINENDDYRVCGVYDAADLQRKIMEQCEQMEPMVRPLCTTAVVDDQVVVAAEIQEIDSFQKPCFYKGAGRLRGSYIRTSDGDKHMSEYEVYSYEVFKQKIHDELRIAERANREDINTDEFLGYMLKLKQKKSNLSQLPQDKIMELQGFMQDAKPTLAGILLFGSYPQAFYPQLGITAVVVPGTEKSMTGTVGERFIDNMRIDGTLSQMLNTALAFVRRNMKTKTIINEYTAKRTDLTEYPIIAVRELILNALIHRDYSIHTDFAPITITMYSDRLEIENPGGLYGRMTLDMLGKIAADTRNPCIANAMEIMDETENRYSGIPTVINLMDRYGLPAPKFENERGVFRVTLFNKARRENTYSPEFETILEFCAVPRSRDEIEERFKGRISIQYLMRKYIRPMLNEGILAYTIPEKPKSKFQKYVAV